MSDADARLLQTDLKKRGVKITLAALRLLTVAQARAAMLWVELCPTYEAWMKAHEGERACRVCGCTDDDTCEDGCRWIEDDLCSSCAVVEARA